MPGIKLLTGKGFQHGDRRRSIPALIGMVGALLLCAHIMAGADPGGVEQDISSLLQSVRGPTMAQGVPIGAARESPRFSIADGYLRSLGAPPSQYFPVSIAIPSDPERTARSFLAERGRAFGIVSKVVDFQTLKVRAKNDRRYVRFQQTYAGIPVFCAEMIVQLNPLGGVESVLSDILRKTEFLDDGKVSTVPSISSDGAKRLAIRHVAAGNPGSRFDASLPVLVIYEPSVVGNIGSTLLVWKMTVNSVSGPIVDECVLVDAHTGQVVFHYSMNPTAKNRQISDANNTVSDGTLERSEGGDPSDIADVNSAYDNFGDVYDFYFSHHGRDSIDGSGMTMQATTRYCYSVTECPWHNAQWRNSAQRMYFGDGYAAADDVVGHELTHGITHHESDLIYTNQSGAINESFSDIWGEFIDQGNGRGTDTDAVKWIIGEDLPDGGIRSMKDPPNPPMPENNDRQPDRMGSSYWYSGTNDYGGVHRNSGVGNKLAYLLTDGATFNNYTVTGMGVNSVANLYYEVQTDLLTSGADYYDLSTQLMQAAVNLGWNATDKQNLDNARHAVEIEGPYFIRKWGSQGTGDGQFSTTYGGICSDPSGYIYVADTGNSRVQKFDSDGNFVTKWGSQGTSNGLFMNPYGICSDPAGNIYVTDSGNNRIQKFSPAGTFITKWGTYGTGNMQFNTPGSVCSDPAGYIYVGDYGNKRTSKFTSTGAYVTQWSNEPPGICSDPSGYIFSSGKDLSKFTSSGTLVTKQDICGVSCTWARIICSDPSGYIYVPEIEGGVHRIRRFSSSCSFLGSWGSKGSGDGQFYYPFGVCSDPIGDIYVLDSGNKRVQKFRKRDRFPAKATGQVKNNRDEIIVTLSNKTVTAGSNEFDDVMYIEDHDRSCGLKVDLGSGGPVINEGASVDIWGTLTTVNGERVITNPTVTEYYGGYATPDPLAMSLNRVGGGALNGFTPGVTGGMGTNNIGLLIRVWGKVTSVDDGARTFNINDGSATLLVSCANLVSGNNITLPDLDSYVVVTGISTTSVSGGTVTPIVRPRSQLDIEVP